jgi:pilus assembly protein Flp/PilA
MEVDMNWKMRVRVIWFDQTAATAIEYGLIVALIAIALITAMRTFATSLVGVLEVIIEAFRSVGI